MIHLTGDALTIEDVVAVARHNMPVAPYSTVVVERMEVSRRLIAATIASDRATDCLRRQHWLWLAGPGAHQTRWGAAALT